MTMIIISRLKQPLQNTQKTIIQPTAGLGFLLSMAQLRQSSICDNLRQPSNTNRKKGIILKLIATLLLLISLLPTPPAIAWSLRQTGDQTSAFLLGLTSGILIHEAGHIIVATSKGYNVDLDGPSLIYPDARMSVTDQRQVSSAGFMAQWLTTETAFAYRNQKQLSPTADNYTAGLICSHLLISAAYLTLLTNHKNGDIYNTAKTSGLSSRQLAALAAIPAILDGWRLFGDNVPKWVPALSIGTKGIGLAATWTY
jgi:hypothetical protein